MNTITATFLNGSRTAYASRSLRQYDYGQILQLQGLDLPDAYQVYFSNCATGGSSKGAIGGPDGVQIPDEYLATGETVFAFVFLHAGDSDGETVYIVQIPVDQIPDRSDDTPTPEQQSQIDQLLAAMQTAQENAEDSANKAEDALQAVGETVEAALQKAKDSGEFDGYSPSATVTQTEDGAIISITDKSGTTTAEVKDGKDAVVDPTLTHEGEAADAFVVGAAINSLDFLKPVNLLDFLPFIRQRTVTASAGKILTIDNNRILYTGDLSYSSYRYFPVFFGESSITPSANSWAAGVSAAREYLPRLNISSNTGVLLVCRLKVIRNIGSANLPTLAIVSETDAPYIFNITDPSMSEDFEYFSVFDVTSFVQSGFNLLTTYRNSAIDATLDIALIPFLASNMSAL